MELISKWKIERDENHAYTVDNNGVKVVLPGVTGILDTIGSKEKTNMLMGWAKKMALIKVAEHMRAFMGKPLTVDEAWIESVRKSAWKRDKEVLKEAGDLGTAVHGAIDAFIAGKEPILTDKTKPGYDNFRAWLDGSGIKLIKGDTFVASLSMGYGGAMDALGELNGELVLLDWKTSNSIRETYPVQAAAYTMAFEETFGHKISKAYIVRFGKEVPGDIEPKEVRLASSAMAFKCALALKKQMELPLWD